MNPRALVTGGARGIGASVVDILGMRGIEVLNPTRHELDLVSRESVDAFLSSESARELDILVLNAGQNSPESIEEISDRNWDETLQVNVSSSLRLLRGLLPNLAARGRGKVVAISSAYASRARPGRVAYSASKAALEAVVRTVAVEYASAGVLANCVAPGFVLTDLTRQNNSPEQIAALADKVPLRRMASPAEVAQLVSFLVSEDNTYITGQTISIDGGLSCL